MGVCGFGGRCVWGVFKGVSVRGSGVEQEVHRAAPTPSDPSPLPRPPALPPSPCPHRAAGGRAQPLLLRQPPSAGALGVQVRPTLPLLSVPGPIGPMYISVLSALWALCIYRSYRSYRSYRPWNACRPTRTPPPVATARTQPLSFGPILPPRIAIRSPHRSSRPPPCCERSWEELVGRESSQSAEEAEDVQAERSAALARAAAQGCIEDYSGWRRCACVDVVVGWGGLQ